MKTVGAILCAAAAITLWVICLRLLLQDAQHDPGGYAIAGFVFLLLPFATVICIAAISKERRGTWNKPRWTQEEIDATLAESRRSWEHDKDLWL